MNQIGLDGEGAEIGVRHGEFSEVILSQWRGRKLYSIDPWIHWDDPVYAESVDPANASKEEQEARYRETIERLAPFGERSVILRKMSIEASQEFEEDQLDFTYIDARHDYEAVKEDIALWWPKIHRGGMLAGDDYSEGWPGVIQAVDEFAVEIGQENLRLGRNNWIFFKE